MKNVMFISNRLGGGGSERVLVSLANEMQNKGYKVRIISFYDSNNIYENEVPVIRLKQKNLKKPLLIINRLLEIRKNIKLYKPDVVVAFEYFVGMYTVIATRGLKCKVIVSERNDPNRLNRRKLIKHLRNVLYGKADILVCQTNDAKNYFPQYVKNKTVVIPNPISNKLPNRFIGIRKKEIINFCRLEPQKNLFLLIDAFKLFLREHSEYCLTIYGEGHEKNRLIEYIDGKQLNNKIFVKNFQKNIHELVYDCAMFVSSSDYEGMSNSMIEAMAMGLPTICTDCPIGGARMLIKNDVNGILTSAGDVQLLYESMKKVAENKEFANRLSKNATYIKDYLSIEKICNLWIDII